MRQIILDTETTGLEPKEGHRIIEIGCIELINRKYTGTNFHHYINPERAVDAGALKIHGITNAFLQNKPTFADIYQSFRDFVKGAELIIHNAPFDVGFLNYEFKLLSRLNKDIQDICVIFDTLQLARKLHPGQRNSLDALCKRYQINNAHRKLHGALLDAKILGDVYLAMTGGQGTLFSNHTNDNFNSDNNSNTPEKCHQINQANKKTWNLPIKNASAAEQSEHEAYFEESD